MKLMRRIDKALNQITMYRLVLYGLIALVVISILFSLTGILPFSIFSLILLFATIVLSSTLTHLFIKTLWKVTTNHESFLITSLILFFILAPILSLEDFLVTFTTGVIAITSRYILAFNKKHIFNPAAVAVFIIGVLGFGNGIWWVGSAYLFPIVLILGLLIIRKTKRYYLFLITIVVTLLTVMIVNFIRFRIPILDTFSQVLLSWPLVFFCTFMMTEPLTLPARKNNIIIYSVLVGLLMGTQFELGPIYSSPELALLIGNFWVFLVSPNYRFTLTLLAKKKIGLDMYEFEFEKPKNFYHIPGQYMEWTLSTSNHDNRGNRRFFTLASSPNESKILLGVKISNTPSSFKESLLYLKQNNTIVANHVSGDFVLPKDLNQKLVFIAGGIGITPYRSMAQHALHNKEKRDVILFYTASHPDEFVYKDIFKSTLTLNWKTIYCISQIKNVPLNWSGETGYLNSEKILRNVPNLLDRKYYLSGPNAMIESYTLVLKSLGIPSSNIVTDYFPGF